MDAINIGTRREVLWDDWLVDLSQTTAEKQLHRPIRRECVMQSDQLWEGDACYFYNIFKDGDIYRMYYQAGCTPALYESPPPELWRQAVRTCYAESRDGLHWVKPALGICEYNGSKENNIILDAGMIPDAEKVFGENLFVFRDENPACPPEELYKGICGFWYGGQHYLKCFLSADAIHFRFGWDIYAQFKFFDSLNTAYYDRHTGKYVCFFRGWHSCGNVPGSRGLPPAKDAIRDIRRMESDDFRTWSTPELLCYGPDTPDIQMYTNNISPYYRADHIWIGFPSRYPERTCWTDNYQQLCGLEARKKRMEIQPRFGYTVTDCLFMCSRDSLHWERLEEAFMRPEPESDWSWVYGDCFPALGLFETPSDIPGEPPELSMLSTLKRWTNEKSGALLYRYGMRVDGFVSRHAGGRPKTLVTKPILFQGDTLEINFETSAAGYLFVELTDTDGRPIEGYRSCELFGNAIDRRVGFNRSLRALNGRAVRLSFTLCEADVYSFRFSESGEAPAIPQP